MNVTGVTLAELVGKLQLVNRDTHASDDSHTAKGSSNKNSLCRRSPVVVVVMIFRHKSSVLTLRAGPFMSGFQKITTFRSFSIRRSCGELLPTKDTYFDNAGTTDPGFVRPLVLTSHL